MLSRYDIVLVAFPFTDGPVAKPRPALQAGCQQVLERVICGQG